MKKKKHKTQHEEAERKKYTTISERKHTQTLTQTTPKTGFLNHINYSIKQVNRKPTT